MLKVYMTRKTSLVKLNTVKRYFKREKNGIFHFVISFATLEIFTILYYANKTTDDVTMFTQRGAKAQNEEYLCK